MASAASQVHELPRLAFSLGDLIGVQGGIGRYAARQEGVDRKVYADVLMSRDSEACKAYVRHIQALGSLSHPVVPRIHAFGCLRDGRLALIHQFREGVPWSELLADPSHLHWWNFTGRSQSRFSATDRLEAHLRIIAAVCHGLEHARAQNLAHGYLVPASIILGELGDVQVIGWEHAVHESPEAMKGDMVALGSVLTQLADDRELGEMALWARTDDHATPSGLRQRLLDYLAQTDAHVLCRDADDLMDMLRVMSHEPQTGLEAGEKPAAPVTKDGAQDRRPRRLIELRVKTLYSMANLVRPEHPGAVEGLLDYHRLLTERALKRGDAVTAEHHLAAQTRPDPRQQQSLLALKDRQRELADRADDFEELLEAGELASRYRVRSTFVVILGASLGFSQVLLGILDSAGVITASHRMYAVLMGLTTLILYGISQRSRFASLLTSDRRARALRGIMLAAMGFPALFWLVLESIGVPFRASLTLTLAETGVIIGMGAAALHAPLLLLAALILALSFVSVALPGYEFELLGAATFTAVVWIGVAWTYRLDKAPLRPRLRRTSR